MGAVLNIEDEDFSKSIQKTNNEDFLKFITKYEGDKSNLARIKVCDEIKGSRWNFSLIVPLMPLEEVFVHPNQSDVQENFIRIIHSEHNCVAIFHKSHFFDHLNAGNNSYGINAEKELSDNLSKEISDPTKELVKNSSATENHIDEIKKSIDSDIISNIKGLADEPDK